MSKIIKIAIADDHDLILEGVKSILNNFGFDVIIEGKDGIELIERIKRSPSLPDVCILDVNMPNMDGCEAAKEIKSNWDTIKIIGFSIDKENKNKMINNGADLFLEKTCPTLELYQAIIDLTS
jgi:DNA-binding NarL/FixJ family response regulator